MKHPGRLPIVEYQGKRWFFDDRLRQIRNVVNPYDYEDLDEIGVEYFRRRAKPRQ